jgi:hypothetical protein
MTRLLRFDMLQRKPKVPLQENEARKIMYLPPVDVETFRKVLVS